MAERLVRVAGIGEVLMDRFESGEATLGGAPLNVVYHLHQLLTAMKLGTAVMVSSVGLDSWGQCILDFLRAAGLDTEYIALDPERPTGTALVYEHDGDAGFEILQNVAWDYLPQSPSLDSLAASSEAVIFGSLAQRNSVSAASIRRFLSEARGIRFYDVNLRRNTTNGIAGYSAEILQNSLNFATIVKMNDGELLEISSLLNIPPPEIREEEGLVRIARSLISKYGLEAVAITRGAKGAILVTPEESLRAEDSTIPQEKVHPVGAGDAFSAGLLLGRILSWSWKDCLQSAEALSSWVVTERTATPALTPEVLAKLRVLHAAQASPERIPEGATL